MNAVILAFLMAFISINTEGAVELTQESIFSLVLLTNSIIALSASSDPSITFVNGLPSLSFKISEGKCSELLKGSRLFSLFLIISALSNHYHDLQSSSDECLCTYLFMDFNV
ncbi:hypothetical protein [Candidatus Nitrosocosmicus sp. R]